MLNRFITLSVLLFLLLLSFGSYAQTDGLHYQAVIIDLNPLEIPGKDVSGNYLSEGKVTLRFTIFRGVDTIEYRETQATVTDKFGLVSLIIGQGERQDSMGVAWNKIEWDGLPKQLQVEIKYEDTDFLPLSKEEMLYVPYAAHRKITASETVIVQGATTLRSTLETDSTVQFHDSLTVDGMTRLKNELVVDQATILNSKLTVENESPTLLTGSLDVLGKVKFKGDLDVGGKLRVGDSLVVMGSGRINNNFLIGKSLQVNDSLSVNGPGVFNQNIQVGGPALFQNNLKVEGSSEFNTITVQNLSQLNGNLNVVGNSSLGGELAVSGITNLNNTLNVSGVSNLNNTLNVSGVSNLNNNLNVSGASTLNGDLSVTNGNATLLSGTLQVEGTTTMESSLTVNSSADLNGQVTIDAATGGGQSSYGAYPLRIQGADQGIAIKLNGRQSQTKNFLTFYDGDGNIHGAVEGQTLNELVNSEGFILESTVQALELAAFAAEAVACGTQLDLIEVVSLGISAGLIGASVIQLVDRLTNSVGVNYSSGGADYAEWLEKGDPNERFIPGEVIGVKNGKISKYTDGADHYMVISTNPAVLGNAQNGKSTQNFEKVAFLGQVPVRIAGKVSQGDYIIPSGNHDGIAIAVSPQALPTEKYREIIGVAWESGKSATMNVVNVAIGLTVNDLAKKVSSLEKELQDLKQNVAEINALLKGEKLPATPLKNNPVQTREMAASKGKKEMPSFTRDQLKDYLEKYGYVYEQKMKELRDFYILRKIDYKKYPEVANIVDKPTEAILAMHDGKTMRSFWPAIESKMIKGIRKN